MTEPPMETLVQDLGTLGPQVTALMERWYAAREARGTPQTSEEGAIPWEALKSLPTAGLKEPPKYLGFRESDAAKVWLIQVERWIEGRETLAHRRLPDPERIALVTSYLEKQAAAWWNLTYQAAKDDPVKYPPIERWDEWKIKFTEQFSDVRTQEQRRDEFDSLRQLSTVQAFRQAIDSRRLYLNPRPSDDDCLLLFKRGLKPHLRNRIEIVPDSVLPKGYIEYVAFADKSEREYLATKNRVSFFNQRTPPRTNYMPTSNPIDGSREYKRPKLDHDGDVEMAFNNLRISGKGAKGRGPRGAGATKGASTRRAAHGPASARPYVNRSTTTASTRPAPLPYEARSTPSRYRSPDERERARAENLCFKCMEPGHRANNCPSPSTRPTRRGGRGNRGRH